MRKKDYATINKNVYNEVAKDLKERHKFLRKNEPPPKDYYEKIMHYLSKNENISYLELGPGNGNVLKYFANKNINTYAIENAEEMIALCRKNSPKTTLIEGNILNVNFNNNSFDIIFAGAFIHLFPKEDLKVVMNKIYSWLNNGGIFLHILQCIQRMRKDIFQRIKAITKIRTKGLDINLLKNL